MKATLLLLFLVVSMLSAFSQTSPAPAAAPSAPAPSQADLRGQLNGLTVAQLEAMVIYQTSLANRVVGVLPRFVRADRRLQLFNPFAPARYGTGYENVVFNPLTGRGEGIAFLTFKF